jgi:bacillithiol biosynthesis deacetylase BshB1|tara:strand:+ start:130 stop:855 length:726 start_codon:yes stop_codon:yes gene_type:complete
MKEVEILAIGAHPDDVELGCAGSISLSISQGKTVAIIDLTQGELGTRGTAEMRKEEAISAAAVLGVDQRINMQFRDGFFQNDEAHQLALISKIRSFRPQLILCNATHDRHIDHGRANKLVNDACFLSGLEKINTKDSKGNIQDPWKPKLILEYIQWMDIEPHIVVDISSHLEHKLNAVKAYKSQFFDPESKEAETPISSKNFIESVSYRAKNFGRLIGTEAGEGFTSKSLLSTSNLFDLVR